MTLLSRTHRLVDSPHENAKQRIVGAKVALFLVLGLDVAVLDFVRHVASPRGVSRRSRLEVLPSTDHKPRRKMSVGSCTCSGHKLLRVPSAANSSLY